MSEIKIYENINNDLNNLDKLVKDEDFQNDNLDIINDKDLISKSDNNTYDNKDKFNLEDNEGKELDIIKIKRIENYYFYLHQKRPIQLKMN